MSDKKQSPPAPPAKPSESDPIAPFSESYNPPKGSGDRPNPPKPAPKPPK